MIRMAALVNRRRLLKLSGAAVAASGASVAAPKIVRGLPAKPSFIILSCDGGGVRGLITALLLQNLNPGFLRKVSLFAGTSTGSIIALALAAGLPIGQIVRLFKAMANCKEIFTPNPVVLGRENAKEIATSTFVEEVLGVLSSESAELTKFLTPILGEPLLRLSFSHYDDSGLEKLLKANLPDLTLAQLARAKRKFVVVPSFQINGGGAAPGARWRSVLFHNLPGLARGPDLSRTSLVNTAMCSAAAPLYFDPRTIREGQFVDGGLSANDPCSAAIAAVLASSLAAPGGLTAKSIVAVSIGTGNVLNSFPGPETSKGFLPKSFGIFGWLNPSADGRAPEFPLIEAMFAGSNGINDLVASMLLRDSTYIRVNPTFNRASTWSLDDCAAIPDMIAQTQRFLQTAEWQRFKAKINAL